MSLWDVQVRLIDLGFRPGPADGVYGPRTEAALLSALDWIRPRRDDRELMAELERDEGRVLHAYEDHLGYLTLGTGRLIDKRRGGGISDAEADMLLRNDVDRVRAELDAHIPWWRGLDPVRQRALINMAFQLGIAGLLKFKTTLAALEAGDYARAGANMRKSLWARQTPARAARVAAMIETGRAAA